MKRLLFCLLAFTFLVAAQADFDKVIPTYLDNTEDYSVFEVVEQIRSETHLTYVLVLVNNTPSFVLDTEGNIIQDQDKITSVSSDYLQNGETTLQITAEALSDSIIAKTPARKVKHEVNTIIDAAALKLESAKNKTETAKTLLPEVDFSKTDAKVNALTTIVRQMRGNATLELVTTLNEDFQDEYSDFNAFVNSLNENGAKLGAALKDTREARTLLNEKIVSVGRDSPMVVQSEEKLTEAEALVQSEIENVVELNTINAANVDAAVEKSAETLVLVKKIKSSSFDFTNLALVLLAIIIVIAGVWFYFKKLKKPEEKVEN
ncbi:MAG: hypothetical protein V1931_03170 [Candidatus Micrarchaeota archaeon]